MQLKSLTQTYNDGTARIYVLKSESLTQGTLEFKDGPLPYDERTVGMSRFWAAKQYHVKIDRMIRLPKKDNVDCDDIVVLIDGRQYQIKQVQYPPDVCPPSMDLSLERLEVQYDIG